MRLPHANLRGDHDDLEVLGDPGVAENLAARASVVEVREQPQSIVLRQSRNHGRMLGRGCGDGAYRGHVGSRQPLRKLGGSDDPAVQPFERSPEALVTGDLDAGREPLGLDLGHHRAVGLEKRVEAKRGAEALLEARDEPRESSCARAGRRSPSREGDAGST